MYVRPSHRPRNVADVHAVIAQNMFATIVSNSDGGLVASHLPFVFEAGGEHGTLFAHMARANPHAAALSAAGECMVVFTGPHGYISPSWYRDRATAPTWDYVAVHCYGRPVIHSHEEARRNMIRLVDVVEAGRPDPWSLGDLSEENIPGMIANIVSFEIPLTRVEGKFKLSQGETAERNRAAVEKLTLEGSSDLAGYIRRYNELET